MLQLLLMEYAWTTEEEEEEETEPLAAASSPAVSPAHAIPDEVATPVALRVDVLVDRPEGGRGGETRLELAARGPARAARGFRGG